MRMQVGPIRRKTRGLPRVTEGYRGLPRATEGYRVLPSVTEGLLRGANKDVTPNGLRFGGIEGVREGAY
eukprot:7683739-Pyramimonas_sp.AAC.2